MMRPMTMFSLVLLITAMATPASWAQEERGRGRGGPGGGGWRPDPQMMIERTRQHLEGLNLTAEQQQKIDQIYAQTTQQITTLQADWEKNNTEPRERMQAVRPLVENLRNQVSAVLTPEQLEQYQQRVDEDRNRWQGRGGGRGGFGAGGPAGPRGPEAQVRGGGFGQGQRIERMREALRTLDLSEEQRQQAQQALDDASRRFEEIRVLAMQATEQTRARLSQILSEEQMQQLQEQMRPQQRAGQDPDPRGLGQGQPASAEDPMSPAE